ncbi:MAG TPA: cytidylate kinase-like family protein [Candidatus Bathyarchaeia archaeon]|nr:cytidylate kinase-like family protein [Candidatus Bathyarchaeia archaeon]
MAIVTIARLIGGGGEEIGKEVAEKLGYEYIGKNRILKGVEVSGEKWLEWGKELDEHAPSPWERFDRSFTGFVSLVESAIFGYALEDRKVITGRGGNWILKDVPFALRLLITGSPEERARRVSDREHVNIDTARRMIRYSDHERREYLSIVYHRDPSDPGEYDMVFDTDKMGQDEVVRLILDEVPIREQRNTPEARETLRRMAVAARVKAAICTDPRTYVPTLEVAHDGNGIVVRGIVHSPKEQKLVMDIANRVAAPTPARSELNYRGA